MLIEGRSLMLAACITSAAALLVSACSSPGSGLTTGSLLPTLKPKSDPPAERATMVAVTSAGAERCGYNFDPAQLRANYLAYETAQGTGPDQLPRIQQSYDLARARLFKAIKSPEEYCTDVRTAEIKRDLTRHRAGDFSILARPAATWSPPSERPFDREKIFDPLAR